MSVRQFQNRRGIRNAHKVFGALILVALVNYTGSQVVSPSPTGDGGFANQEPTSGQVARP